MTLILFAGIGTEKFRFESLFSQSGYPHPVRPKASFQSSCGCKTQVSRHPASGQISCIDQLGRVVKIPYDKTFNLIPPAVTPDSIRPSTVSVESLIECTGNATVASEICS